MLELLTTALPLLDVAVTSTQVAGYVAEDPVTAVGGVTGIIAGITQVIKMARRWEAEKAMLLALGLSLFVSIGLTVAIIVPLVAVIADAVLRGFAYFIYTTGLYRLLSASGVPLPALPGQPPDAGPVPTLPAPEPTGGTEKTPDA